MSDVRRQKAGFMHVHLTDNQLYNGSCVGNLVSPGGRSKCSNQTNARGATVKNRDAVLFQWC